VIAAVSFLSLPLTAQEPPRAEVPIVSETIDVRVVNVEAVVTDGSGQRVRGLTARDFEALSLEPSNKGYQADVPIAVASQDEKGGRADLPRLRLQVAIEKLPQAGTFARFQTVLQLRNEKQQLIFTVHDPLSGHALWGEADLEPGRAGKR
jgi:hypothetical protein